MSTDLTVRKPTGAAASAGDGTPQSPGLTLKEIEARAFAAHVEEAKKVCINSLPSPPPPRTLPWIDPGPNPPPPPSPPPRPSPQADIVNGFTDAQAEALRGKWGFNELPEKEVRHPPLCAYTRVR